MNKKLAILSCLIVFAFGMQTAFICKDFINGFVDGFNDGLAEGQELRSKERPKPKSYLTLKAHFIPDKAISDTLMIYNDKTAARMPVDVEKISMEIEEIRYSLYYMIPFTLLLFVLMIVACVQFCKLIMSVAKSKIFEWSNVRRLRYIGGTLIALFLFEFILGIPFWLKAKDYVSFSNYRLDPESDALFLILGLFFLLIAEIFAKGLRLQEEQELTI